MKRKLSAFYKHLPWLLLLLCIDIFAVLLLWLCDARAFVSLSVVISLASLLLFGTLFFVLDHFEQKKKQTFLDFLTEPDNYHEEKLLKTLSVSEADAIRLLGRILREKEFACNKLETDLADYEEYVEEWAHEAKTPLSLLTMILDNRKDEISAPVLFKLDYIRSKLGEDVTQILYYARLKGTQKDYIFESVDLCACIKEVLEDYRPLLIEKQFLIDNQIGSSSVFTDQRGLRFILSQIISNAIKYSSETPKLTLALEHTHNADILRIQDNGIGVRSCDLPYIFEKGFTGETADNRKKATGMGLYLSKKMADDLALHLDVQSEWKNGFEISISFPIINKETNSMIKTQL